MRKRPATPVRKLKDALGVDYRELAAMLGISYDYARKLGCGSILHVSPKLAAQFERRTGGRLQARELVRRDVAQLMGAA